MPDSPRRGDEYRSSRPLTCAPAPEDCLVSIAHEEFHLRKLRQSLPPVWRLAFELRVIGSRFVLMQLLLCTFSFSLLFPASFLNRPRCCHSPSPDQRVILRPQAKIRFAVPVALQSNRLSSLFTRTTNHFRRLHKIPRPGEQLHRVRVKIHSVDSKDGGRGIGRGPRGISVLVKQSWVLDRHRRHPWGVRGRGMMSTC